jgi:hypothetical protein
MLGWKMRVQPIARATFSFSSAASVSVNKIASCLATTGSFLRPANCRQRIILHCQFLILPQEFGIKGPQLPHLLGVERPREQPEQSQQKHYKQQ